MSMIQFENEQPIYIDNNQRKRNAMVNWLIKIGIVKDEKQATYILLVICLICLSAAVFIFVNNNNSAGEDRAKAIMQQINSGAAGTVNK
ncbi:MAG: hypothetical protein NTV72_02760 [Candidatus Taylorbacteria bacterium]|nr:hypothetical protein [Candidatus Taylorbacteria bacterium]